MVFAFSAGFAMPILTKASYIRKQIIAGAKSIHTNPNIFFTVFIVI
jgi:hypothetical protein